MKEHILLNFYLLLGLKEVCVENNTSSVQYKS